MRWSSMRVFVRPCSVNRLQSTSHENSYRGPTLGLIELNFFYTYSRVNRLCFGYFHFFLSALRSIKNYVYVSTHMSLLSHHTGKGHILGYTFKGVYTNLNKHIYKGLKLLEYRELIHDRIL